MTDYAFHVTGRVKAFLDDHMACQLVEEFVWVNAGLGGHHAVSSNLPVDQHLEDDGCRYAGKVRHIVHL